MKRGASGGSVLVIATWLLAILALLAISISFRSRMETRVTSYDRDMLSAFLAVHAGVARLQEVVQSDAVPAVDALNEPWASHPDAFFTRQVMPGVTQVTVWHEQINPDTRETEIVYGAEDEQGRLHLNAGYLTADILARLPSMDLDTAHALLAFRDSEEQVADDEYYQTLSPPYLTKQAGYESMAEVSLVRGMTPERFKSLSRYCTVYPTGGTAVNVNTASPIVLEALGLSPMLVQNIIDTRTRAPFEDIAAVDALTDNPADVAALVAVHAGLGVQSSAVRAHVNGATVDGDVQVRVEVVLRRSIGEGASSILAWWHE